MSPEPVASLTCKHCGNETPTGKTCTVCSRPLPRPLRSNAILMVLAVSIVIFALGIVIAMAGAGGSGPA